ncbi:hypothetical protein [Pontibacter oryzae]|uniref:Uncharacterized protein n=1 Tax=Pontibacter oryzae TaxID=2304593 RepID=A0A399SEJ0_9BACT|nr:hypothetical protein [Pontibacter oryzae]RIJ41404.1 hypothetical protein D1627_05010 [Pontibacter oryzae]
MSTTLTPSPNALVEACYIIAGISTKPCIKVVSFDDEPAGYATIDGNMVTHLAGSDAVSNGAGIFIGDYFVGIADTYQSISITPFVRY